MTHIKKTLILGTAILAVALLTNVAAKDGNSQPQITAVSAVGKTLQESTMRSVYPDRVVELFTSQGCSSCPPANKFASDLAQSDKTSLILSYGVTYWDYLGWEDTFADPTFTKRQRHYMKALQTSNIYTPQMIINGTDHSPRYKTAEVQGKKLKAERVSARLSLSSSGKLIVEGNAPQDSILSIVRFTPGLKSVDVSAGENTGRTLELENVVEEVFFEEWNGQEITVPSKLEGSQAYAALFHAPETLEILTAVVLQK